MEPAVLAGLPVPAFSTVIEFARSVCCRAAGTLTVGFNYDGPKHDCGRDQVHAQAGKALWGMPGLGVGEEQRVPETGTVEKTMESMIVLYRTTPLFRSSFGDFSPHVFAESKENPVSSFAVVAACGSRRTRRTPVRILADGAGLIPEWHRHRARIEAEKRRLRWGETYPPVLNAIIPFCSAPGTSRRSIAGCP